MSAPSHLDDDRPRAQSPQPPQVAPSARRKARREVLPPDCHLLRGEQPYELIDGRLRPVAPALPPHAIAHFDLSALLRAHINHGYQGGVDLLTRADRGSDFAADASLFSKKEAKGGGRRLEEVAFEVISTLSRGEASEKAARLSARGVRRVYAIDVKRGEVLAWQKKKGAWQALSAEGVIADRLFARPIPVSALLDAGRVEDEMARALDAKNNPVIVAGKEAARQEGFARGEARGLAEGEAKGLAEGEARGLAEGEAKAKAEAVVAVLAARGIVLSDAQRRRIAGCRDVAVLDRWLVRAATATSVADVLGQPPKGRR